MVFYKKSVYVFFYNEVNLGDDLFVTNLVRRYPDVKFIIIADKRYRTIFHNYTNVKVYDKFGICQKIKQKVRLYDQWEKYIINACDYAVYIGGSVFMEYEQWTDQYKWYQSLFDNNRLFFLGCNWGPCKTKEFHQNMIGVLSGMKDVCFRDIASYNAFKNLENVRYAPDILFGTMFKNEEIFKKQVFVSVIDCCTKEEGGSRLSDFEASYVELMKELIEECVNQQYSILVAAFCEKENDHVAAKKIVGMLENETQKHVRILSYCGTNQEVILNEIRDSNFVIATRFHAAILGMTAGKPVLPVVYSDKTINVLNDIGFQGVQLDIRKKLSINFSNIIYDLPAQKSPYYIEKCKCECEEHFKILDHELNS